MSLTIFCPFYLSETIYVINSFNPRPELQKLIPRMIVHEFIDHLKKKQYT